MKTVPSRYGASDLRKKAGVVLGLVLLAAAALVPPLELALARPPAGKRAYIPGRSARTRLGPVVARARPESPVRPLGEKHAFKYGTAIGASSVRIGDRASGSASVRVELDESRLQFVLRGSTRSKATSANDRVAFETRDGTRVTYERIGNEIKESIILMKRPVKPWLEFDFTKTAMKMARRKDGYHFLGPKGEELFWVRNPVAHDAAGRAGGATLAISGSSAFIRLDSRFLASAKYPVTVDPTIVSTATSADPAGLSIDRHIVRSSDDTLVVFYQSGSGLQYKTSTDNGSTWGGAAIISPTTSNEFAVFMANNDIYVTYRGNGGTDSIFFRKLTYSGGAWTTGPERLVEGTGNQRRYPSIVRESGGRIWVTYWHRTGSNRRIRVRSSTDEGATWSGATTLADTNNNGSSAAVIYGGRGAVVFEVNDASLQWSRWNPATGLWSAPQVIVSGDDYDDANWGSLTTSADGNLHLVYAPQGGGWIRYTRYNGTAWSSPLTLSQAAGDRYPSISTDGTQLWAIWSQRVGTNQHHIVYRKNNGSTWSEEPKRVTGPGENAFGKVFIYGAPAAIGYSETLLENEFVATGTAQNWRGDNQSWLYTLPAGFEFPFYDTTRTSVYVCSNGFLDFTSPNTQQANTAAELRSRTMIAGLWDDLRTNGAAQPGEDIYVYQPDSHSVVFRWVSQTVGGAYPVNFAIRLFDDGTIKFDYGSGNTGLTPTVGISSGNGTDNLLSVYDDAGSLTDALTSRMTRGAVTTYRERTVEASNTTAGDVRLFANNGDGLYVGMASKFDYIYFDLQTAAGSTVGPVWEYWDGTTASWSSLTLSENPGYGFTASDRVAFTPPANWQPYSVNGSPNLYYVRVLRGAPALAIPPVATQFTAVRDNVGSTAALADTTAIPVDWSEGVAAPFSVRFAALPLVDITLSIEGTYDRNGASHRSPPFRVDFGDMDPSEASQYVTREGAGKYAASLKVVSDANWDLVVQANDDLKDGAGNTVPISDLKWATDGSSTWTPFVKVPAAGAVLSNQPANFPAGSRTRFDYQFNISWLTTAGDTPYGTTLTYTAVQRP